MADVILDIDSVGDDILAVLYGALHKKINLLGITTVNGACGSIEQAVNVALNTVELTGRNIPVYAGADKMLAPKMAGVDGDPVNFDEELRWKFGERLDKFNETVKKPEREAEKTHAVDYLIQAFNERPGEIILVTTGPVTNIALAVQKDPSIAGKVKEAYILGGAFQISGNITPVTEYNIWADPEAAKIVLNSDMKITLVPLDVCENNRYADGMMTRDHLAEMKYEGKGAIVDYIADKFPIYIDIWREFFQLGGFPMDDVITLALAVDPELCEYTEKVFVDVELEGDIARGQTVAYFGKQIVRNPKKEHKNTRIARSIDGKKFMDLFVKTIIGQ
ncbi:purine nucleosidase [Kineothrix alysoides]|uniref:Purine nucleosidase n=1 Tax=Kineothrix alysoides TaxID=1469948 RepID=A0A4R1QXC1_9FIRM|nr:nucleoside hydrolase [Kineothrix alysoides]TCL57955.1 purine nucleosidase [Kineothrix alysoides]